jgi:tetrapyrrole methylase family protein/MazG family protein
LSFLEPVCTALELDPLAEGLQILDGTELSGVGDPAPPDSARWLRPQAGYVPTRAEATEPFYFSPYSLPVPPEAFPALQGLTPMKPLLVTQVYNDRMAAAVKLALLERYPADHPSRIVMAAGVPGAERVIDAPLHELDRGHGINHLACVYLPPVEPLANARDLDALIYVMGRLRGPGGCPWDRKQTAQSIKHDMVEEVYEALDALDADDPDAFAEELGDVLMQVIFHAQLAAAATFTLGDVVEHIVTKLVRRHPHVFGELEVRDADEVLANWQRIKGAEQAARREQDAAADDYLEVTEQLRSVPRAMPALEAGLEISRRAVAAGFEWANIDDVYKKVHEELRELREAPEAARFEEFGDLLFTLVNIARWLGINPEEALRAFNRKFVARFAAAERLAVAAGHRMRDLPVEEQDRYWNLAKQQERET